MLKKGVFWALHTRHLQNGTAPPRDTDDQKIPFPLLISLYKTGLCWQLTNSMTAFPSAFPHAQHVKRK